MYMTSIIMPVVFTSVFVYTTFVNNILSNTRPYKLWQGTSALSFTFLLFYIHNYIIYSYVDDLS